MKKIGILGWICQWIVILWAIIGGVAEVFKFNVLSKVVELLHLGGGIYRIVMIVVGAAGVFLLFDLILAPKKKA
ncbi:MAG: hypothetical protein ABSA30_00605 [Candidatus Aminicenantales bacterium]|jgi:uncharacterized membrane protein YuzA (DUF378 family)